MSAVVLQLLPDQSHWFRTVVDHWRVWASPRDSKLSVLIDCWRKPLSASVGFGFGLRSPPGRIHLFLDGARLLRYFFLVVRSSFARRSGWTARLIICCCLVFACAWLPLVFGGRCQGGLLIRAKLSLLSQREEKCARSCVLLAKTFEK